MVLFLSVLGHDMERGAQISVYMGHGSMGVMNEVWHFSSSNKNQRKFHGVQCPLKKADKSKPLHPNFRLFSKQPTTDKKGW